MKALLPLLSFLLLSLLATPAFSQEQISVVPPPLVGQGFAEFQKNGTLAAMSVWLAGSAKENDEDQDRAVAKMNSVQGAFGRMTGYEVVRVVFLSPSTQRVYTAVKYEKSVAWMSFDCYRPGKDWIISRFDYATNANLVLPPSILGGQ
jgi:hypothetical protein